jgi:hypothetical protein
LNISDNVITVNVASPGVRFGGLSVFDSGSLSSEATASLFWDSQNNHWIYQRESGSTYNGGMLISGPRNAAGLGNELGTTACMLLVGQGGDHLTSSLVYHDSTRTCVPNILNVGGALSGSSATFSSILGVGDTLTINTPSSATSIALRGRSADNFSALRFQSNNGATTYSTIYTDTSNLIFENCGSERMRITCCGNVGIGTTGSDILASFRLGVACSGGSAFIGVTNQCGASGDRLLRMGFGTNHCYAQIQGTRINIADDIDLALQPNGGNVGINTVTPSSLLHINTTRTSGANVNIMTLSDNVTGVQTSGFGVRILATSNNGQAKSAIAFEADGGTNNDTAIAFYTQTSAACLAQRLIIDKNGTIRVNNLGGSTNYKFGVAGSAYINGSNNKGLFITDNAAYASIVGLNSAISAYNPIELRASGTDYQLYLATNGNVGIRTCSPTKDLHVCGGGAVLRVGPDYFVANGSTDRDYIDLIADGSTTQIISPNEMFRISNPGGGAGSWCIMMITGTGGVVLTNGSTSWASASDLRLKNINSEITNATSKLNTLRAINFSWKTDIDNKNNVGLIAQEVEKVFPEVISYDPQVDSYGIRYTELIPVLVKAVQEQHCTICSQASMINTLKTCIGIA